MLSRPRFWIWLHGCNTLVWLLAAGIIPFTPLADSVVYVNIVSNLALAFAEAGAWQAARAEKAAVSAEDVAAEVCRLLEEKGYLAR